MTALLNIRAHKMWRWYCYRGADDQSCTTVNAIEYGETYVGWQGHTNNLYCEPRKLWPYAICGHMTFYTRTPCIGSVVRYRLCVVCWRSNAPSLSIHTATYPGDMPEACQSVGVAADVTHTPVLQRQCAPLRAVHSTLSET